jgi:pyruvate-formate lyase
MMNDGTEIPLNTGAERAAAIRQRILDAKTARRGAGSVPLEQGVVADAAALQDTEGQPWPLRCGKRTRQRLASLAFAVDDHERLAGRPVANPHWLPVRAGGRIPDGDYASARTYLATFGPMPGQTGHCEPDFSIVLAEGVEGLRQRVRARRQTATDQQALVLDSFLDALDGLSDMILNAAAAVDAAVRIARTDERHNELEAMAAACCQVVHGAPRTFQEAIQLLWFVLLGVSHGDQSALIVPGRMDRTLASFYERDLAAGRLTREQALELIEALYFLINDYIPDGLAMAVMVGGRNAEGQDTTHALSHLCLEALRRTRLVYPTVGICWHSGTPESLTGLAVELIAQGYATPAFFGDATIQRGLQSYGVPPSESCRYINSTCVEITPSGASNIWVASPYFSTCRILLEELAEQAGRGADAAATFAAFMDAYLDRLGKAIGAAVAEQNHWRDLRQRHGGKPLQSVFTLDCVARARDIDAGGARYNWVECSFVGLANLADSLHVIREEVYQRRTLTLAELQALLAADFAGHEPVRLRLSNEYPKYGNGCDAVDELVARVVQAVRVECDRHRLRPDNSPFVPGAFCWIMHERLGAECGATPDGRRAGLPFADGGGPAQGRESQGPTAAILSTTSWDHAPMIGGVALNLKFSRELFHGPAAVQRLRDLVVTYLQRGGFEVQVNVVDREALARARAHPDQYRDLVVRIGGYTDYFTRLSPAMQDEVMRRTEFKVV